MTRKLLGAALGVLLSGTLPLTFGQTSTPPTGCENLPDASRIRQLLIAAANAPGVVGGLFQGKLMWGAVVNRDGVVCAFNTSTENPRDVWPGSEAIAKAKAYTANAFSNDAVPLSTANLFTFTQPGHSLWSLAGANVEARFPPSTGAPGPNGGMIFFGGGVPLYNNGKIVGGLGVSGDTSCADHEIAKRARDIAGMNPPGGMLADDIQYGAPADRPSAFVHSRCLNTYRNGTFIGTEDSVTRY